jgi:hypothetical protein
VPLNSVTYHMRVLQLYGAARLVGDSPGSTEARYESTVSEDRRIIARLAATKAGDDATAPRPTDKRLRGAI